ncbi:nuclear distribution protein [Phlyctema vagabunda]|uniref:Nuclear distribution protein n=1 Tax=Phlyctema vagabunda TaxID=108571 RepID=A0ABR4P6L1_9HELO
MMSNGKKGELVVYTYFCIPSQQSEAVLSLVPRQDRHAQPFLIVLLYQVVTSTYLCNNHSIAHYSITIMAMDLPLDKTATETIDLLEARLRRIEYALRGGQSVEDPLPSKEDSATKRLQDLEHTLHELASRSRVIQDLLRLRDARYPDLFQAVSSKEVPTSLDAASILSIVLASASSYPSTASRLTSITDMPIPSADSSAQLIELQPRIAKVEVLQRAQQADIAELRQRTAATLQRWYALDVLGAGDGWAELEGRVEAVEQRVRRATLAQKLDTEMV